MSRLDELASKRDQILLAEIGTLIHDLGKLSREFMAAKAGDGQGDDVHHIFLRRYPPQVPDVLKGHSTSQNRVETALRYLDSIDSPQTIAMGSYLRAAYEKNPQLYLEGSLRMYVGESPQAADLATQVEEIVSEYKKLSHPRYGELTLAERVAQVPSNFLPDRSMDLLNSLTIPGVLSNADSWFLSETIIGEIIEGHHSPPAPWRIKESEYLSLLRASEGVDGFDSWIDKGQVSDEAKQLMSHTFIATAFGYEPESQRIELDTLTRIRHRYANALTDALECIGDAEDGLSTTAWLELLCNPKTGLRGRTQAAFRHALGETRRSANDVTLWDHCYSTASLYKASLTKVLLESSLNEEYEFPSPSTIGWRFLRVGVDGLEFFGQVHHVTDMLGRRDALAQVLDEVRLTLEIEHPLGNEIYRDENGSVFVMPALDNDIDHQALAEEVNSRVEEAFRQMGPRLDIGAELIPQSVWNDEGAVRGMDDDGTLPDMRRAFGKLVSQTLGAITADPQAMDAWWREPQSAKKEICTVCGVRPVGYKPQDVKMPGWVDSDKAEKRHVCCVCLNRRGRRAETWLTKQPPQTIWVDEVVDVNGRFALIAGRFDLNQWLDGTLVRTMLIAFHPDEKEPEKRLIPKNPSPARIRRCWETTRQFWEEIGEKEIPGTFSQRPRLAITPKNQEELKNSLGAYHTYELRVGGASIGVVWDPIGKQLILTEYLRDLGRRLGLPEKAWKGDGDIVSALRKWLEECAEKEEPWPLFEPSGYLSPASETGQKVEYDPTREYVRDYIPHIPLLTEPALFMALVPADKAMDVVQAIKEKYEREMSKVRDRLPLHLGVTIAQRRTPIRAVLEAGRAMLGARGEGPGAREWEEWQVEARTKHPKTIKDVDGKSKEIVERIGITLSRNGREIEWTIPTVMGDGETPDQWYPHLLKRPLAPGEEPDVETDLVHVKNLKTGDKVYIAPSTFDFEYLDTTARRFEIAYDETGQRRGRPTRPYLLEEVETLRWAWDLVSDRLSTTQWMALDGLIEQKRREWNESWGASEQLSGAFKRFVKDALRNVEWKRRPDKDEFELLESAAIEGVLNDVINLYHEAMKEKGED